PIGALAIAAWVADRKETVVAPLLCIISVALIVPRALVEGGRFIYNGRATYDATLEWLSPIVNLPLAMPSVHRDGGSVAIRDAAIWVAALAVVYVIARSVARKSAGARWAVTCWAAALAAMVASTLVWNFRDAPIVTPDRSKLAALADLRAWKTHTLHIVPLRRIAFGDFLALMSFEIALPVARINRVPAGEYDLILDAPAVPQLRLFVGRNDPPIESLPIDGRSDNSSGYRLRLPVSVQTLSLATAGSTPAPVTSMTVRPVALVSAASGRAAVRAARYGDARAFAFDEQVYLERDGFWVRGDADTAVVIDSNDAAMRGGLPLAVVAGPVATTITVSANGWRETLTLGAGETRHLTLPPSDNATWAVSLKSGAGFRPSQREPGNRDVRLLAAWISLLR
ncbi:MAG TPA: hypothetical protein VEC39_12970, partial [Vicinamibacterales bacterium]|nr:hypothetical protein [Vicinamibacterales bacterium]